MSNEQEMREAFEDTYRSRLILDRRESGEYVFTRAITAWDAWQAATLAAEARIRELADIPDDSKDALREVCMEVAREMMAACTDFYCGKTTLSVSTTAIVNSVLEGGK